MEKITKKGKYKGYTDEQIIEVISKYETIKDLRLSDDRGIYPLCFKRGLREFLPAKRTRSMNLVGTELERKLLAKEQSVCYACGQPKYKDESKKIDRRSQNPGRPKRYPEKVKEVNNNKVLKSIQLYKHTLIEGVKVCGRCFTNEPKTPRSILCKDCQRVYSRQHAYDKEHVPYNVYQEYCNTIIKHHEKTFEIGIKVDEKMQNYLTLVGYQFIFKEPWENIWK